MRTKVILVVIGLLSASALAGPLASHPNAFTDDSSVVWRGTTTLYVVAGSETLSADVDWCVFAPGGYPFDVADGYTPTPGEFVYAYQIDVTGTLEVNTFWVNMADSNEANNIGAFDLSSGVAPTNSAFGSTDPQKLVSANWTFGGALTPGLVSDGLAYSSVNAPEMGLGFIQDGGLLGQPQGPLPTPSDEIPEPLTMTLLAAGALALLRRK